MTVALSLGAILILNGAFRLGLAAAEITPVVQSSVYLAACLYVLREKGVEFGAAARDWLAKAVSDALSALKYACLYLAIIGCMLALAAAVIRLGGAQGAGLVRELGSREELYSAARTAVASSGARPVLLFLSFCVLAPLGEEFFFRRILYTDLRKKMGFLRTLFASSVIFAATHGAASLTVFPVSLLLGYVYEKKRRLPVNIMLHGLINLFVLSVRLG